MAEIYGANVATDKPGLAAGEAQIFDTSHLEKQIQDQIDQEHKRQDLQNQVNSEALNKIDLNGVRSKDQSVVEQKYQTAYQNFRKLQLAQAQNDRPGQIAAQSALDRSKADLQSFVGQSKDDNQKQAVQYADMIHNRASYTPDAITHMQDLMNTSSVDPNYATKSDISQFVKEPPKVDLNELGDKIAKESVVPGNYQVVKDSGAKFDQRVNALSFPILKKRAELEYTKDPDTQARLDQIYNPTKFDPTQKAALEKAVGSPLNTAADLYAADYYTNNKDRYNIESDRKQVTEHIPRAGATVINFGNGQDQGSTPPVINVSRQDGTKKVLRTDLNNKPILDKSGKQIFDSAPNITSKQASVSDGLTFAPIRIDVANSPSIRNANTGNTLPGSKVQTLIGGQMTVLPVYKSGPHAGTVVPDDEKDDALKNGQASYRIMFHGNQDNNVGLSADGGFVFSKDATPVYTPATNSVIQALQLKTSKDKMPALSAKLAQMQAEAQKLNSGVSQPNSGTNNTIQHHKIKY